MCIRDSNWGGDLASLREDLDPLIAQGYAVTLFSGTPKGAAALTRDLTDKGYSVSMSRDVRPAKGIVQMCIRDRCFRFLRFDVGAC